MSANTATCPTRFIVENWEHGNILGYGSAEAAREDFSDWSGGFDPEEMDENILELTVEELYQRLVEDVDVKITPEIQLEYEALRRLKTPTTKRKQL